MIVALALGLSPFLVAYYTIFHRRSPRRVKMPADLKGFSLEDHLPPDDLDTLCKAFLKGPDFAWFVEESDKKEKEAHHTEVTHFMSTCMVKFTENYGYVLVKRDDKGEFLGSVCLIPPVYSETWWGHFLAQAQFLRSVVPMGIPVPEKIGGHVNERFQAFINATGKAEKDAAVQHSRYWLATNVAVSPNAQGKGVGRELMQAAIAFAHMHSENHRQIFLSCHDGNVKFYEKMGFKNINRYAIREKDSSTDSSTLFYNGMMYKP